MYFRALKFLSYFIEMALFGLFGKTKKENLNKGLEKTKESVFKKLARVVVGKSKVDDEVLDNLEEVLITSDVGVEDYGQDYRTYRGACTTRQIYGCR